MAKELRFLKSSVANPHNFQNNINWAKLTKVGMFENSINFIFYTC